MWSSGPPLRGGRSESRGGVRQLQVRPHLNPLNLLPSSLSFSPTLSLSVFLSLSLFLSPAQSLSQSPQPPLSPSPSLFLFLSLVLSHFFSFFLSLDLKQADEGSVNSLTLPPPSPLQPERGNDDEGERGLGSGDTTEGSFLRPIDFLITQV